MKVSVVTPTYCRNAEGLLAKCLDSAMAQTFEDFELIVIDVESMTTQEMKQCFGRKFYGHGETQWIRDGKVVAFLEAYTSETEGLLGSYFKRLLES